MILVFLLEELGTVGGDIALVNGTEAVADGLLGESMEDLTEPSRQAHSYKLINIALERCLPILGV